MNLHLLRLFSAVARHRGFSLAAEALHISQPAVSKGVRELEGQLGTALLERGPGGVRLTESGEILMGYAQSLFAVEQAAEEAMDALRGLHRGTLRIGASTTIATYVLPPILSSFAKSYPAIELRLTSANTASIADLLVSRELDVAMVEGPINTDELMVSPWRNDELVFIVSPAHPLASRPEGVSLEELAGEAIVLREPGSGTRDVAWEALQSSGIALGRILEVSSNEAIAQVVAAGFGIGIVSSAVVADQIELGRVVRLEVGERTIRRTLSRLFLPGRQPSPAAIAFDRLLDDARTEG
ncbi:LysR family transcriptional regulator [Microvirga mediterraneensis]|nr:LysR family transcriptional regulator [Microvirga mediterraneensis]